MKKNYITIIICIFGLLLNQNIYAQCLETNMSQGSTSAIGGHSIAGQSFKASCGGSIKSISIMFTNLPNSSTESQGRILHIRDGGTETSTIIHSQAIPYSSLVVGLNEITLTSPLPINNGEENAFEITDSLGSNSAVSGLAYTLTNTYADGVSWFSSTVLSQYDLEFEVSICSSSTGIDVIEACDSIVWLDGITYKSSNNTATYSLTNVAGCDSVVTLDLTITIDKTIDVSGNSISANETGATYQWVDCSNGNAIIAGETSENLIATKTGNYAVEITKGSCVVLSNCQSMVIEEVGITDYLQNENFNIFPNPTNGMLNINLKNFKDDTYLIIYNAIGTKILQQKVETADVKIDLSKQIKGVYFVKIYNEYKSGIEKIILR